MPNTVSSEQKQLYVLGGVVCLILAVFIIYAPFKDYTVQKTHTALDLEAVRVPFSRVRKSVVSVHATFEKHTYSDISAVYTDIVTNGTGFFVGPHQGYIMTAAHLVRIPPDFKKIAHIRDQATTTAALVDKLKLVVATEVTVTLCGGQTVYASIVRIDSRADVAILKVDDRDSGTPLELDVKDTSETGDQVVIIGNAFGVDSHSCAVGHIRNRRWKDPRNQNLLSSILTTVSTANGVSGAPIVDMYGTVVGIHLGSMEPMSPRVFERIARKVANDPTITSISDTLRYLRAQETGELVMISETGAMTVGSSDTVALSLDTVSEDGSSTTFGGGLRSSLLHKFVEHAIRGGCTSGTTIADGLNATKSMVAFGYLANNATNRVNLGIHHRAYNHNNGYLVVHLDAAENTQGLHVHDCVTHANGVSVGTQAKDASLADVTWFVQDGNHVILTVDRAGTVADYDHTVSTLSWVLDYCSNSPQDSYGITWGDFWQSWGTFLSDAVIQYGEIRNCLHPDTMIETENGPQRVDEIQKGQMVRYSSGTFVQVIQTTRKNIAVDHEFVQVDFTDGTVVLVSPSHPMPGDVSLLEWLRQHTKEQTDIMRFQIVQNDGSCTHTCDIRTQSKSGGYDIKGIHMLSTI